MRIPFANRTADVDLPAVPGQPKVTVRAVIDALRDQVPRDFETLPEAFVFLRLGRCVLHVVLLVLWRRLFTWALPFGIPP